MERTVLSRNVAVEKKQPATITTAKNFGSSSSVQTAPVCHRQQAKLPARRARSLLGSLDNLETEIFQSECISPADFILECFFTDENCYK